MVDKPKTDSNIKQQFPFWKIRYFYPQISRIFSADFRGFWGFKPLFCENLRKKSAKSAGKNIEFSKAKIAEYQTEFEQNLDNQPFMK
jgi:hypothetical protein